MGYPLIRLKSRRLSCNLLRGKQTSAASFFCLFVFLAYFLLPITYFHHFSIESTSSSPALQTGLIFLNLPNLSNHNIPCKPFHDSSKCPICQASQNSQDSVVFVLVLGPVCSPLVKPLAFNGSKPSITASDLLGLGPRPPPIFL